MDPRVEQATEAYGRAVYYRYTRGRGSRTVIHGTLTGVPVRQRRKAPEELAACGVTVRPITPRAKPEDLGVFVTRPQVCLRCKEQLQRAAGLNGDGPLGPDAALAPTVRDMRAMLMALHREARAAGWPLLDYWRNLAATVLANGYKYLRTLYGDPATADRWLDGVLSDVSVHLWNDVRVRIKFGVLRRTPLAHYAPPSEPEPEDDQTDDEAQAQDGDFADTNPETLRDWWGWCRWILSERVRVADSEAIREAVGRFSDYVLPANPHGIDRTKVWVEKEDPGVRLCVDERYAETFVPWAQQLYRTLRQRKAYPKWPSEAKDLKPTD